MPDFKPLNYLSQLCAEDVFYFNADASTEALMSNATARIHSLMNLHSGIAELKPGSEVDISYLSAVSTYLLSDAYSLLAELETRAEGSRDDKALIDQQAKAITALSEIIGKNAYNEEAGIRQEEYPHA
ncbi:hypothetical protein DO659_10690 [Salmonella enterica subsp. enterica serovar Minnesota]|nr:hypothetical protein [Salmonella enterica subsp. enterica serovar Minnesota]